MKEETCGETGTRPRLSHRLRVRTVAWKARRLPQSIFASLVKWAAAGKLDPGLDLTWWSFDVIGQHVQRRQARGAPASDPTMPAMRARPSSGSGDPGSFARDDAAAGRAVYVHRPDLTRAQIDRAEYDEGRLRAQNFRVQRTRAGSRPRIDATLWSCSRSRRGRACPS